MFLAGDTPPPFWTDARVANTIAGVAVLLTLITVAVSALRPWWRNRKASFEVREENLVLPATVTRERGRAVARLVVVNHGPAIATAVHIDLGVSQADRAKMDASADAIAETFARNAALWPTPIPTLHPGQSFHLPLSLTMAVSHVSYADVRWHDRRRGEQDQRIWLSTQYLV